MAQWKIIHSSFSVILFSHSGLFLYAWGVSHLPFAIYHIIITKNSVLVISKILCLPILKHYLVILLPQRYNDAIKEVRSWVIRILIKKKFLFPVLLLIIERNAKAASAPPAMNRNSATGAAPARSFPEKKKVVTVMKAHITTDNSCKNTSIWAKGAVGK